MIMSRLRHPEIKIFQMTFLEKIKTRISCQIHFFENRAVYEIITKNTAEPDKA